MWLQTEPEDLSFPQSHCPKCDRRVLLHRDLDEAGALIFRCLDCGEHVPEHDAGEWSPEELTEAGYRLEGQDISEHKGSCGNCGR